MPKQPKLDKSSTKTFRSTIGFRTNPKLVNRTKFKWNGSLFKELKKKKIRFKLMINRKFKWKSPSL